MLREIDIKAFIDKEHMGNSKTYEMILHLLDSFGKLNIKELLLILEKEKRELVNPVIDITSSMIYGSFELEYTNKEKEIVVLTRKGKESLQRIKQQQNQMPDSNV